MRLTELLLLILVGWTLVGALGVTVSFRQQQRPKALHHLGWIVAIWIVYLSTVIGVSLAQKQRFVAFGAPQCYDEMCFAVVGLEELPGYPEQSSHLVRVKISITNHGHKPESESLIRAYLVDQQGRHWGEEPGLSGVKLTARISGGESAISEPVFKLPADASPAGLILSHGRMQPGVLVIADSDSLFHKPTIFRLAK
ncbi:hypothetical protein [Edaphobacter flagellatus]|uniref:hypothetical protein n=1 Tax=Edaphobacter flagellatus TaxID=1933044 RepID=UPI0021B1E03A|nr:hypothetical protein [Edaphobacter flagellatus]